MSELELIIKAVKEDPVRLAECLEENSKMNDDELSFLAIVGDDPHFNSVSLGCKAARLIALSMACWKDELERI